VFAVELAVLDHVAVHLDADGCGTLVLIESRLGLVESGSHEANEQEQVFRRLERVEAPEHVKSLIESAQRAMGGGRVA
jgi:hypothetical protein